MRAVTVQLHAVIGDVVLTDLAVLLHRKPEGEEVVNAAADRTMMIDRVRVKRRPDQLFIHSVEPAHVAHQAVKYRLAVEQPPDFGDRGLDGGCLWLCTW